MVEENVFAGIPGAFADLENRRRLIHKYTGNCTK
jgi:hypothetical protein